MGTRDLLLLIGFLRSGRMYPSAVALKTLPESRSLKIVHEGMADQERALFGKPNRAVDRDDIKRRSAMTSWSGELLAVSSRIGEVPDPGVVLCLLYDGPAYEAPLPVDVFAQTLRRYALRDPALRVKFDEHVDAAGTYVPAWLSPEVRKQKSQDAFDAAMRVAREQGFAHAAPLFEGVRGDCFPAAQVAIAVYEMRELGDHESALRRLNEVVRVAPRNVAARMQRANLFATDSSRKVEAANDWLHVLRELVREASTTEASHEVAAAAMEGLWGLHREYADPRELEAALDLVNQDVDRGFEALSRYVHTHPCAWDAQAHLASIALSRQKFELTSKLPRAGALALPRRPEPALRLRAGARVEGQPRGCAHRARARLAPRARRRRHREVARVHAPAPARRAPGASARRRASISRGRSRGRCSCCSAWSATGACSPRRSCCTSSPATSRSRSSCRPSRSRSSAASPRSRAR